MKLPKIDEQAMQKQMSMFVVSTLVFLVVAVLGAFSLWIVLHGWLGLTFGHALLLFVAGQVILNGNKTFHTAMGKIQEVQDGMDR